MKTNVSTNEIDKLEKVLSDFEDEWEYLQKKRSSKWRSYFLISFIFAVLVSLLEPEFWWLSIIVIAYFAGSLFTMLRQRAKTTHQILEHQKQLKLVRLLRNFQSSPYSRKL